MGRREDIVVGLDIGTSKVCALVGAVAEAGVEIIGIGTAPSKGLKKGVVIDIARTVESIRKAIDEAELMAGCSIGEVYAGIAGGHIKGFNSTGVVGVKDKEIRQADIARVIDSARALNLAQDREVLHVLPQEFIIDEQDGIKEPLGMAGVRLQAKVHIVTGAASGAQNIVKCCRKTNLEVVDVVLAQLAAADAVLNEDEKDLGVVLVDIGGGTTDLAVYINGSTVHTAVIPLGGDHVTNDIAIGLRTPTADAERIKVKAGCASVAMTEKDEVIRVPGVGNGSPKSFSRVLLAEIIEPRLEELLIQVHDEIRRSGFEDALCASGIVLTGGTSHVTGLPELAEEVMACPVRIGYPSRVGGLSEIVGSPAYATAAGLVLYGTRLRKRPYAQPHSRLGRGWQRLRGWLTDFF